MQCSMHVSCSDRSPACFASQASLRLPQCINGWQQHQGQLHSARVPAPCQLGATTGSSETWGGGLAPRS